MVKAVTNTFDTIEVPKSGSLDLTDGTPPTIDVYNLYQGGINVRQELDRIVRDAGFGSMSSIGYLTMRGFNYLRHGQQLVHGNRDNMGYVFFTRPCLNLTYDNLSMTRTMTALRNAPPNSINAYVRALLDPWGQIGKYGGIQMKNSSNGSTQEKIDTAAAVNSVYSSLVDPSNPFIPILSNLCTSLTGWKDIALNDYTSQSGVHNEQNIMVDGHYYITNAFELSGSFKNIEGDPISLLFRIWTEYMIACRQEGLMNPYPTFVERREFDYNTRIYRFIMDSTRTYIQKMAATIAYPTSVPSGNQFNYSSDKNFIDTNSEISITFKCVGQDIDDPILVYEFNTLVAMFNPNLAIDYSKYDRETQSLVLKSGNNYYYKLKPHEKNRGVFMAIPLINHVTMELEWWIDKTNYVRYVAEPKNKTENRIRPSFSV